jgi:hypothetical protein
LNESETDVIIGPCSRPISVAAEELRIPYLCVTSETEMELCTFKLLPVLSDFIEAMTKLVYSRFRRHGKAEPKTIIYEGKKGENAI